MPEAEMHNMIYTVQSCVMLYSVTTWYNC